MTTIRDSPPQGGGRATLLPAGHVEACERGPRKPSEPGLFRETVENNAEHRREMELGFVLSWAWWSAKGVAGPPIEGPMLTAERSIEWQLPCALVS